MKYPSFMVVAGEASGDILAAELVAELRAQLAQEPPTLSQDYQPFHTSLAPRFFGAGGERMQQAGVEIDLDLTAHAVTGLTDVLKNIRRFRKLLLKLRDLARRRLPDAVICVDFSGFNRRLAHAIRKRTGRAGDWFHAWRPLIVQYVSPQVWASRPGRAATLARDYDLLLSTFPFELEWYRRHAPRLPVEFVGNPIMDRYAGMNREALAARKDAVSISGPRLLLLPGSRVGELQRHLPIMFETVRHLAASVPELKVSLVLPNDSLLALAKSAGIPEKVSPQVGRLAEALAVADVAIASTGTVLLECAVFGVPTVALYRTSWLTYQIGKRIVTVDFMAMPNLLSGRRIMPEFIQDDATTKNVAGAALELLRDPGARAEARQELARVVRSLGGPGASRRAAMAILARLR